MGGRCIMGAAIIGGGFGKAGSAVLRFHLYSGRRITVCVSTKLKNGRGQLQ
ncbi:MAG: hypothetical protein IJ600_05985 [Lachnospiraceae bacterium]|nr:hypothetical protein [Lachnospiraceae bacterium]